MPKKLTTSVFICRAKSTHGNIYDYSRSVYLSAHEKLEILCKKHGSFWQTPNSHVRGRGCPVCAQLTRSKVQLKTTSDFIREAKAIHGNKYSYSCSEYVGSNKPIEIICDNHGSFFQLANNHLKGFGCGKCGCTFKKSTCEFVESARSVHGLKYGYSKTEYRSAKEKVCITCDQHGDFWQIACNHLSGNGCPSCSARTDQPTKLYLLTNGSQIKVGLTIDIKRRLRQHARGGQPFTSDLVATWTLQDHPAARAVESKVHKLLVEHNAGLSGFDGATEWFNVSPQVAADAIKRCLP